MELHKKDPEKYTDDNHKPEIAVALSSKFEVFVGWKPLSDIATLFNDVEPLKRFLPQNSTKFDNETLKAVCRNILSASDEVIAETQQKLGSLPMKTFGKQSHILDLLPRLQKQYSKEDPGELSILSRGKLILKLSRSNRLILNSLNPSLHEVLLHPYL